MEIDEILDLIQEFEGRPLFHYTTDAMRFINEDFQNRCREFSVGVVYFFDKFYYLKFQFRKQGKIICQYKMSESFSLSFNKGYFSWEYFLKHNGNRRDSRSDSGI